MTTQCLCLASGFLKGLASTFGEFPKGDALSTQKLTALQNVVYRFESVFPLDAGLR